MVRAFCPFLCSAGYIRMGVKELQEKGGKPDIHRRKREREFAPSIYSGMFRSGLCGEQMCDGNPSF